ARHQRGELGGARERALLARADDRLRHAARETLFAEGRDHLANLVDARPSEPGRDGLTARRVHTHVERPVSAEAETTSGVIELRRRYAKVEEHAPARAIASV